MVFIARLPGVLPLDLRQPLSTRPIIIGSEHGLDFFNDRTRRLDRRVPPPGYPIAMPEILVADIQTVHQRSLPIDHQEFAMVAKIQLRPIDPPLPSVDRPDIDTGGR